MGMVEEEMREDKIRHIGQEIVEHVPLSGTATADSMAEEEPTKNHPSQHIECGITTTKTASRLDYQAQGCSGG